MSYLPVFLVISMHNILLFLNVQLSILNSEVYILDSFCNNFIRIALHFFKIIVVCLFLFNF